MAGPTWDLAHPLTPVSRDSERVAGPSRQVQWVVIGGPYTGWSHVRQCQLVCPRAGASPWHRARRGVRVAACGAPAGLCLRGRYGSAAPAAAANPRRGVCRMVNEGTHDVLGRLSKGSQRRGKLAAVRAITQNSPTSRLSARYRR